MASCFIQQAVAVRWTSDIGAAPPVPAITIHPSFPQPEKPLTPVWRYMDFAKLVSLLQHGALYFPRLDRLADPFEGSLSRAEFERIRDGREG